MMSHPQLPYLRARSASLMPMILREKAGSQKYRSGMDGWAGEGSGYKWGEGAGRKKWKGKRTSSRCHSRPATAMGRASCQVESWCFAAAGSPTGAEVRTALICYDGSLVPARRSSQAWVQPFAPFFGWTSGGPPPGDGICCSSRTKPCPSTGHKCEMVSGRIKSLGKLGWGGLFRLEPIFVRC